MSELKGPDNQERIKGSDDTSGFSHDIRMWILGVQDLGEGDDDGGSVGMNGSWCEVSVIINGEPSTDIDHLNVGESRIVEVGVGVGYVFRKGVDVAQNLGAWMGMNGDYRLLCFSLFEELNRVEEVFDAESKF